MVVSFLGDDPDDSEAGVERATEFRARYWDERFTWIAVHEHPDPDAVELLLQEPGALGATTGGDRTKVPALARAAVATGNVDGLFFEVHPDPDTSPSDGPNMVRLEEFDAILEGVVRVHRALSRD